MDVRLELALKLELVFALPHTTISNGNRKKNSPGENTILYNIIRNILAELEWSAFNIIELYPEGTGNEFKRT